jgi:anhydro-N-acetylmuramic acid kinase
MKARLALGLMSGTSADGVSLALIEVRGRALTARHCATYPYPPSLSARILAACGEDSRAGAAEISRLGFELGRLFARAATRFLWEAAVEPRALAAVGSHGQTLVHLPGERVPSTLQIGEPSFLAETLRVPVVSDFRPRDMAAGGQGAPLVPFFDAWLFGGGPARVLQNVGGVANASLVGKGLAPVGFDTGPGNSLIDVAARRAGLPFDRDGELARGGRVHAELVEKLARDPYFARKPPKSLDRGAFGEAFYRKHLGRLAPRDAAATATALTARTIVDAWRRFLLPKAAVREAVVSGGGALNPVLMERLRASTAPLPVRAIDELGVPAMAKEAAAFALMALLAVEGEPNHCPEATGARGPRILGKISR